MTMAVGRAERREAREARFRTVFGDRDAGTALDLFEIVELAWHDCYQQATPPQQVVEDILTVSRGSIAGLIEASKLAIADSRDLRMAADEAGGNAES